MKFKATKSKKGKSYIGYIKHTKKIRLFKVLIYLIIIAALFATGLILTGSRNNWFTLVAVILCLPFAKALVGLIVVIPYKSIDSKIEDELYNICGVLPLYFEIILNDEKTFYVSDVMCIMNHNIIIYCPSNKTKESNMEKFFKSLLAQNGFNNYTIKVWKDYDSFVNRLTEMESSAQANSYLPSTEHIKLVKFIESVSL